MKKFLIVALLFLSVFSQAQTRRRIAGAANYIVITRTVPWSDFLGAPAIEYILDQTSPSVGGCMYIVNNNPINSRTVSVGVSINADNSATNLTGGRVGDIVVSLIESITVPAGGTISRFYSTFGGIHVYININSQTGIAGGTPDTAKIFWVNTSQCLSGIYNANPNPSVGLSTQLPNNWSVFSAPAVGAQATIAQAASIGNRHTADCYQVTLVSNAAAACGPATVVIRDGACGAGTVIWQANIGTTAAIGATAEIAACGLRRPGTTSAAMCIEFGGGIANCFETVNLAGFDQH